MENAIHKAYVESILVENKDIDNAQDVWVCAMLGLVKQGIKLYNWNVRTKKKE